MNFLKVLLVGTVMMGGAEATSQKNRIQNPNGVWEDLEKGTPFSSHQHDFEVIAGLTGEPLRQFLRQLEANGFDATNHPIHPNSLSLLARLALRAGNRTLIRALRGFGLSGTTFLYDDLEQIPDGDRELVRVLGEIPGTSHERILNYILRRSIESGDWDRFWSFEPQEYLAGPAFSETRSALRDGLVRMATSLQNLEEVESLRTIVRRFNMNRTTYPELQDAFSQALNDRLSEQMRNARSLQDLKTLRHVIRRLAVDLQSSAFTTLRNALRDQFMQAVTSENFERARYLVEAFEPIGPDITDNSGMTLFHWAVEAQNFGVISFLTEIGADVTGQDGNAALRLAFENRNPLLIRLLIKNGADAERK